VSNAESPYDPPKAEALKVPEDPTSAHIGRRFLNLVIDYLGAVVLMVAAMVVAVIVGDENTIKSIETSSDFLFGIVASFAYYFLLEASFGRTLGKFVTRTKVVNEQGLKPSFPQIFARTACRYIPFEPFSIFFSDEHRCWHDSLSKTYVVRA